MAPIQEAPTTQEGAPPHALRYVPLELAERLDRHLGDPGDPGTVFSYQNAVDHDVKETFPEDACAALDAWGLPAYYVPAAYGGALTSYEELLGLIRTLARRDVTVALGHGMTFLGSVCAWVAGDPTAGLRLGPLVRDGAQVCLGLTERSHGSDLLAGEVTAEPADGHYRVSGEKWLINNATRSRLVCVLARTSPVGGPRGFSLLLIDKRALPQGVHHCTPKVPTLGVRGADISGIVFDSAPVDRFALVDGEGCGSEVLLKALQITRTLCPGLSLGAADHALRLTVAFARDRRLYGRSLTDLPLIRRTLAETYADLLTVEAVSTVAARSIQALTDELSVTASVTKYLVPSTVDRTIGRLGSVLGARSYLAGTYAHGMFQKVERDHRIVGIFDGNTLVNQYQLVAQFRSLARHYLNGRAAPADLGPLYDLGHGLAPLDPSRLTLLCRGGSSVLGRLPEYAARLREAAAANPALDLVADLGERLLTATTDLHHRFRDRAETIAGASEESFADAQSYALCFAGAACVGLWLHNHEAASATRTGALWRDGLWLHAALARLVERLGEAGLKGAAPARPEQPRPASDALFDRMLAHLYAQYEEGDLFSLLPCRIAEGPPC
jgi:alkylation response protein AidB-like acyl-CoA dehydrogenase